MVCVFCSTDRDEGTIRLDDVGWYICGNCSQKLMAISPEKVQSAYDLAIEKGLDVKAMALKSFIGEEDKTDGREPKNRKSNYRKRTVRTVRDKKRKPWEPKER